MKKGKKKRKQRKPSRSSVGTPKGHDFGSPKHFLLVANVDFTKELTNAKIFACAYGATPKNTLDTLLPVVSVVGEHADSLKSAFQEFKRWGADEDGDVVGLTFVFLKEGGYLLGVYQDPNRMDRRLRGYDRVFEPIQFSGLWAKKFDSRHPMLEQLQKHKRQLISPFLFSAAIHPSIEDPSKVTPNSIRQVEGLEPILKFEANFVREEEVKNHSLEWGFLQCHRSRGTKIGKRGSDNNFIGSSEPSTKNDPESFQDRRQKMLYQHFPVTLSRARRSELRRVCIEELSGQGVQLWQIDQAICNLILSRTICGKDHYISLTRKKTPERIALTLQSRFEQADAQDFIAELTSDAIRHQIELDCKVLLHHFKVKYKGDSLGVLIRQLSEEGLLNG